MEGGPAPKSELKRPDRSPVGLGVLFARASSRDCEPLKLLRSTFPEMPETDPLEVYCQNVQVVFRQPAGRVGLETPQCATHSGLLEAMPPHEPVQVFHHDAVV
ncbi:hypothetical protein GCM10029992_64660 [Glycomyces albus]